MRTAEEVSIKRLDTGDGEESPRSELVVGGKRTGLVVKGAILELAVRVGRFYLLFLTNDIEYEDVLHIHLISESFSLEDSASIGYPYSTGTFALKGLEPPDTVCFDFIGGTEWRVTVLDKPRLRIPIVQGPKGVWRGLKLREHFKVTGRPQREAR